MSAESLKKQIADQRATIETLQHELLESNNATVALALELEQRVDARTAELRMAHEKLQSRNSELLELTRQLDHRVMERTKEIRKLNLTLQDRVAERTAELTAANHELEAFAYSVSHDLRAPLRHMDGFLALLVKRAGSLLDDQSRRYLDKVTGASRTMGNLIDDLLQFSRMGRSGINKAEVNLARMVEEARLELETETAGRTVNWDIGTLPEVVADAAMLRLVITNLISNALKFTRRRIDARIEVGSLAAEGEDVIFVKDNGVGFDIQYAGKLFNVFQRLHQSSDFEGTGIGLANVRRIIERHGGRVWAEASEGVGATFYFSLPTNSIQEVTGNERKTETGSVSRR